MTDGTPGATRRLGDLEPGVFPNGFERVVGELAGRVLLEASDFGRFSLWASAGQEGDAVRLAGNPDSDDFVGAPLGVAGSRFLFGRCESIYGCEPWRTDGSPAGTGLVADLGLTGVQGINPHCFTRLGDRVVFVADDGDYEGIWRTDGTMAGTERLTTIGPPYSDGFGRARASTVAGGRLFLVTEPDIFFEELRLFVTDGTAAGTRLVFAPDDQGSGVGLVAAGQEVYLVGPGLWKAGAASGSQHRIADVWGSSEAALAGGKLYFAGSPTPGGDSNLELWTSDGTTAGTRRVEDIRPGLPSSSPRDLVALGGRVIFTADDGEHGRELWVSDGSEAGTRMILDLVPGGSSVPVEPML